MELIDTGVKQLLSWFLNCRPSLRITSVETVARRQKCPLNGSPIVYATMPCLLPTGLSKMERLNHRNNNALPTLSFLFHYKPGFGYVNMKMYNIMERAPKVTGQVPRLNGGFLSQLQEPTTSRSPHQSFV